MSTVLFSVRRRDLAWTMALVVLLSSVWVARGDMAEGGETPPGDGIAVVYVAVGNNFPDSLGVGPAGGVNNAPIIIVPTNPPIPGVTSAELVRLDPQTVIIVGGTTVVSQSMQDEIEALLPNAVVTRIDGADRYATNAAFSAATYPVETWIAIPAAAFTAPSPASENVTIGAPYVYNSTFGETLYAPLHLPHGSEILEFKMTAADADAADDVEANLIRANVTSAEAVASVSTSGSSGVQVPSTTAISNSLVDNENYAYLVTVFSADGFTAFISTVMVKVRLGTP